MTTKEPAGRCDMARFVHDENGAVTVDWVVMTAAVVGMALLIVSILAPNLYQQAGVRISEDVATASLR